MFAGEWGSLQRSPDPLALFNRLLLVGERGQWERRRKGKGEGRGEEVGRWREGPVKV